MSCSAKNPKESAGEVSAASYLKIPKGLPGKFMIRRENEALKEILIQFLSALSFEIDIEPFLEKKKTITQTVNLAMTAWLKEQYDSSLLKIFEPEIYIFVTQWDDNFETNPENLKITVSNAYMTWDALEITKEVETCEKIEKGNGTLVQKTLSSLQRAHQYWTPLDVMQFVREMFWMGMDTEAEYKQEMGYADEEDPYMFNEKSLEPFKKWEQSEIPENIRIIKPVEKLVRTCKRIKDEPLNGLRYNTEFPETILWKDNGNIIENLLTEFEQMEAEGDWYNPHAGGLLWEGKTLNDFKTILSEVKTYIRQKNELVKGILTFKGDMKKWQK